MFYEHKAITTWENICYQEVPKKCSISFVSLSEMLLRNAHIEMHSEIING